MIALIEGLIALGVALRVASGVMQVRGVRTASNRFFVGMSGAVLLLAVGAWLVYANSTPIPAELGPKGVWVGQWALAAGAMSLAGLHRTERRAGAWASLASGLVAGGAGVLAIWLLLSAPRVSLDLSTQLGAVYAACNSTFLAGALAFLGYSLLVATEDESLSSITWLGLGLVLCTTAAATLFPGGLLTEPNLRLLLVDSNGASVDVVLQAISQSGQTKFLSLPALDLANGAELGGMVLLVSVAALLAALSSTVDRRMGRLLFGLVGLLALFAATQVAAAVGPVDLEVEAMIQIGARSGVPRDLLVAIPTLTAEKVFVHQAAVAPAWMALWVIVVFSFYRALAPLSATVVVFKPTSELALSRDGAMVGALLFWIGLAFGQLGVFEMSGRFVGHHSVGVYFALAAACAAVVFGWHVALNRGSRSSFGAWFVLPTMTLVLASMVVLSGLFTAPFSLSSILP
ncbi:MAG: hypothetical protein AUK47_26825 [Deltaproteobacteria bacterium CG2_30_63_29]|nr:MAG: hypothetical protein AUK47_26825 [Deltaproteobacteria bacterium CG2_30_63_29]